MPFCDEDNDSPVKQQLLQKIADQANELAAMNVELQESRMVMNKIENRNISLGEGCGSTSRDMQRKRIEKEYKDKFLALEKQLALSNSRLNENSKVRNHQVTEIEKITREYKFFKSQTVDLQKDNQTLKAQLHTKDKLIKKLKSNAHEDPEPLRQELEKANHDLEHVYAENEELKLKVKVLEDALEFRADEIGLAGHADLLSKIAHFRGEVNALKNDLQNKHVKLETVLHESTSEREKNEKLNEDVAAMQQRLMEAKHDMSRIQSSKDLLEQLKDVETERDVLVNFIQDDMKKSAAITEKYDATEAVLESEKRARVEVERKLRETTEALGNTEDQLTKCHDIVQTLKSQLDEGREVKHVLEMELNEVKISLNRKTVEADELFKMQSSLLTQSKQDGSNRDAMEKNIRELTAKVHDLELQMTYLKKDNDMFVQKNSLLQEEVLRLTEQIKELEPKLLKLEPEYTRLSEEKSLWSSQRENNNKELHEYKLVSTTLNELHYGLQSLTESEGDVAEKHSDIYTLSQKHVMWCGIPALRRLSSPLYDRIREMFQDLRRMEKEISDCRDNYEVDAEDLKVALRNKSNELEQKVLIALESKKKLEQLTYRLQECESELHDTRETSAILDNVRIVLKSSACTVMSKSGISPSKSNKSSVSRFHPTDYNDLQQPLDDMNLYDLAESGLDNDGPTGNEAIQEADMDIANKDIPSVLSRTLVRNLDSVTKVVAYEQELAHLRHLSSTLQREKSSLLAENEGLKQASRSFRELSQSREQEHSNVEKHSHNSLNQAAELTERQNTLIAKLEDKLAEFRRKMLLKASQVTSLQQRENSLQKRLFQTIIGYARSTNIKVAISEESALPELVKVASSLLQDSAEAFQDKEFAAISKIETQSQYYHGDENLDNQKEHINKTSHLISSSNGHNYSKYNLNSKANSHNCETELWEPPSGISPKRRAPPPPQSTRNTTRCMLSPTN